MLVAKSKQHDRQAKGIKMDTLKACQDKNDLQGLEMTRDKLKHDWTYRKISGRLKDLGYKTRTGNTFETTTVRSLPERSERWKLAK